MRLLGLTCHQPGKAVTDRISESKRIELAIKTLRLSLWHSPGDKGEVQAQIDARERRLAFLRANPSEDK